MARSSAAAQRLYSQCFLDAMQAAWDDSQRAGFTYIDTHHILSGILSQTDTEASKALKSAGITVGTIAQIAADSASCYFPPIKRYFPLSRDAYRILDIAINTVAKGRRATINDLLLAFYSFKLQVIHRELSTLNRFVVAASHLKRPSSTQLCLE